MEPIQQVSISVDHSLVQSAKPSVKRPDLDQRYPESPVKEKGWTTQIDLSSVSPGLHEIEVRAFAADGCQADIAAVAVERVSQ
jgi:hypothetical protein